MGATSYKGRLLGDCQAILGALGCSWAPLGRLPWNPPLFTLETVIFIDAWLAKVVREHLEGLVGVLGHFGHHFGFLASFWPSWAVSGCLFGPSWPKMAQVRPRLRKKLRFLDLTCGLGRDLGSENLEKSMSKTTFFSDAFLTSIFIGFLLILGCEIQGFWACFLNDFWN